MGERLLRNTALSEDDEDLLEDRTRCDENLKWTTHCRMEEDSERSKTRQKKAS